MGYDKRISELPQAGSLDGTELLAVVQNGVTKYTSLNTVTTNTISNYGLFNQTGSSVPVSGSTNNGGSLVGGGAGTLSVPANGFKKGDAYELIMSGYVTAQNGHTLDIHIDADGIRLADTGIITMATTDNRVWKLTINFSINEIGSAGTAMIQTVGTFQYRKNASDAFISEIFEFHNDTSFDTTIDNALDISANWAGGSDDDDAIYSNLFTLKKTF